MYAVIKAGSRQFKVSEGETLIVDRLPGNAGDKYTFDRVLMVGGSSLKLGNPVVPGAKVEATIKSQEKAPKVMSFWYRRRKNSKKIQGHRQPITVVEINKIHG